MTSLEQVEVVDDFTGFGVHAFTTTRHTGTFSMGSAEPARDVIARWDAVRAHAAGLGVRRLATASQVHGARILSHAPGWDGWLRGAEADGHFARERGTALAVSVADCVPIFIAHPAGATALLHSGWRGTAARIVERGIAAMTDAGFDPAELSVHLGPAICGKCYEVSADVARQVTGEETSAPRTIDLREIIARDARRAGVTRVTTSPRCTRCDNDRFYSHRAGDAGRQIAVIFAPPREV
jgi:YfiH family protein